VVCNNTQGNVELPWRFGLALKKYPFAWMSMSAAKKTKISLAVLFWPSRKSLTLKIIHDCGSDWSSGYASMNIQVEIYGTSE